MDQSFLRTLRSELEPENPLALAVVLVGLALLFDASWTVLATIPAALLALAFLRAGLSTADAPEYASGLVIGTVVAAGAGALAVLESSWALAIVAAVGLWLVLDSLYDRRHGIERSASTSAEDPLADSSFREGMAFVSDAQVIVETLRESPTALTPAQIADRAALSSDAVERVLADLDSGSPIERASDDRYTVDESKMGASGLARDAVRRLCRPFSVLVPAR